MTDGGSAPAGLPPVVPLFPLAGILLLPHGQLPLHIFEPRYLAMVEDSLSGDGVIAMIQPLDPADEGSEPDLYSIGCAGRITEDSELEDGRRLITLTGLCRFNVTGELALLHGYRRANADYAPYVGDDTATDIASGADVDAVFAALQTYFTQRGIEAYAQMLRELPTERMVNQVAMMCPFEPPEKQALLQARTLVERSGLLTTLLDLDSYSQFAAAGIH
jgi:Lon protease-like protein